MVPSSSARCVSCDPDFDPADLGGGGIGVPGEGGSGVGAANTCSALDIAIFNPPISTDRLLVEDDGSSMTVSTIRCIAFVKPAASGTAVIGVAGIGPVRRVSCFEERRDDRPSTELRLSCDRSEVLSHCPEIFRLCVLNALSVSCSPSPRSSATGGRTTDMSAVASASCIRPITADTRPSIAARVSRRSNLAVSASYGGFSTPEAPTWMQADEVVFDSA